MFLLAVLIGWYAAYGAARQVVTDSRQGIRNTRERAGKRVGEIRKDRKASRVKRMAATGAVWTGQGAGVVWRGARHTRRSITTGVRWGAGEGRERHRERVELGEVQSRIGELGDRETDAGITEETPEYAALHEEYYTLRDQHRADRAGRAGRPVPEKVAARIDRRRAQTEAGERGDDPGREPVHTDPEPVGAHRCDGTCRNLDDTPDGACGQCGGQGELVWNFGAEHGHPPCPACNPDGPRWKRPRLDDTSTGEESRYIGLDHPRGQAVAQGAVDELNPDGYTPDHPNNTNGGTTMSTPVSTANGTGLNALRTAWATFGDVASEQVASSADAQGHVVALAESANLTLTDAQATAAAAGLVLSSLADSEAATPEDVADAEAQQTYAAGVATLAEQLVAAVETAGVAVADLSRAAEAGQAHCASSLTGLNQRHQPRESFYAN